MNENVEEGTALNSSPATIAADTAAADQKNPTSGGSYLRNPQSGELQQLVEPPKPPKKKQTTEE